MSDSNVVIRKENPGQGQGTMRAVSARTGWEYEHDETDDQIDAIEGIIAQVREEGSIDENSPGDSRGALFSWTSDTNKGEGNITLATMYKENGSDLWTCESWIIAPGGSITEQGSE